MAPVSKKPKSAFDAPLPVKGKGKAKEPDVSDDDDVSMDDKEASSDGEVSDESTDTDMEIALSQQPSKSKQTLKRKRRAIQAAPFGQALTALLETSTPGSSTQNVLALNKSVSRKQNDAKLEKKARKVLLGEKKEREDTNRVTDVIGGWGGESERALRKVAQRGVVQLFNAIQQAQTSTSQTVAEQAANRGTGKPTLPAPDAAAFGGEKRKGKKNKEKDNVVGRAKPVALGQEDFLQSIRAGAIVSKV